MSYLVWQSLWHDDPGPTPWQYPTLRVTPPSTLGICCYDICFNLPISAFLGSGTLHILLQMWSNVVIDVFSCRDFVFYICTKNYLRSFWGFCKNEGYSLQQHVLSLSLSARQPPSWGGVWSRRCGPGSPPARWSPSSTCTSSSYPAPSRSPATPTDWTM